MLISVKLILISNVILVSLDALCEGTRSIRRNNPRSALHAKCPIPKFKNGIFRLQRGGRMSSFECKPGFEIHGPMQIMCQMGRWKQDIPICKKSGCTPPRQQPNGRVIVRFENEAILFCNEGFYSSGATNAYCDGEVWDREIGSCRQKKTDAKLCDFESIDDPCGWTPDANNDFNWIRRNGWTSFEKLEYGPRHDHTIGKPLVGHYMVAEATNSRSTQRSRLLSPIYDHTESLDACFRFYYHMYGFAVGRLRVILKPFDKDLDDVVDDPKYIRFEETGSKGNQWNEGFFKVTPMIDDFQIVFEATGSNSIINDIAIDDLALLKGAICNGGEPNLATEEDESDGIYDLQSCANRCSETQPFRNKGQEILDVEGHLTEKCDCHPECMDLGTCCPDYRLKCLNSEPTESDTSTTPVDGSSTEMSSISNQMTLTTNASETVVQNSTITTTPLAPTSTVIITTTSLKPTQAITVSIISMSTISSTPATSSTPLLPGTKNSSQLIANTSTPIKTVSVTMTPKTTPKRTTISDLSEIRPTITAGTTAKAITNFAFQTSNILRTTPTHRSTKLNITVEKSTSINLVWMSSTVFICTVLLLTLIHWRFCNAKKWTKYNSQQIEYKSKSRFDNTEEALIRSNSFIIDDAYSEASMDKNDATKHDDSPKMVINNNKKSKPKKVHQKFRNEDDLYSENRCLTADDEHFNFSMQTDE